MKNSVCFLSTTILAGLSFHVAAHQTVIAEDRDHRVATHRTPSPDPRPVHGGLRGIASASDDDAGRQLTDLDRARMRRGVEAYVAEFGPLSRSDDHSGFAGDSPALRTTGRTLS